MLQSVRNLQIIATTSRPKFHLARHVTTRHDTVYPTYFGTGKSRDVLCRACRAVRRDTRVTTSARRMTRSNARIMSASAALTL